MTADSHATATAPSTPVAHPTASADIPAPEARWRPTGPVLLASDGSAATDATTRAAHAAAAALGVPVRVVAVLEPLPVYFGPEVVSYTGQGGDEQSHALRAAVAAELARAGEVATEASAWPVELVSGDRRQGLAEAAAAHDTSLVVVGEGSHRLLDRVLVGELALDVLRRVRCPVLSVAPGFAGRPRVAVAGMDFSPASVRAAQAALRLLAPGGRLVLVHANAWARLTDPPSPPFAPEVRAHLTASAREQQAEAGARLARVRALLDHDNPGGVTIDVQVEGGDPAAALLAAADAAAADLMAVGTHGGGWLDRLMVGSVAQTVVRHAGRSVLAARAPGHGAGVALDLWAGGRAEEARPEEWATVLDALTRRNRGRPTRLLVSDAAGATYAEQDGMRLVAAVYDRRDRAVALTFAEPGRGGRRFTHHVPRPERLTVRADAAGREAALEVAQARGITTVTFLDAPAAGEEVGSAPAPTAAAEAPASPAPGRVVPPLVATAQVRDELRGRRPRAEAEALVTVTPAPVRSCYLVLEHVSGPRDAVLDYTAFLLSPEGEPPDGAHTRPEFVAVEYDDGERLSLVLSRALFDGGEAG